MTLSIIISMKTAAYLCFCENRDRDRDEDEDEDNSRRGCFGCEHHIPDFLNKKVDELLQTICGIVDSIDRPTNLTDWKATILLSRFSGFQP